MVMVTSEFHFFNELSPHMPCRVLWRIDEDNIALQIQGLLSWCPGTETAPLISLGLVIRKTLRRVLLSVAEVFVKLS